MKARRICLIGPAGNVHVQRWASALLEQGQTVSIISTGPLLGPMPPALNNIPIYTIPTAHRQMRPHRRLFTLLQGWGRVPGLVSALGPELVHLHSLPTPAAVPALQSIKRLVVSAWGSDVVQRDRRKARMYPWLLAHAAQITATSGYLSRVTEAYLRQPRAIHVVPFGVDPRQFTPASSTRDPNRIGTLRHLEANYGLDVLVAALPRLLFRKPYVKVIVGGEGSLRRQLEQQAHDLGVAHAIRWQGRVDHAEVPSFLRSLSLFVMPSRAESFGVAALEAQASGLPVVGTEVGGLPEVVSDGVTGLLVSPEQPYALAEAVLTLLDDPSRRAAMGEAAREWVSQRYDWRVNVAQMLEVYALVDAV